MKTLNMVAIRLRLLPSNISSMLKTGHLHTSIPLSIKEIVERKEGKQTVIEGIRKESGREPILVKTKHDKYACSVCRLDLEIKHTDVLILSQFVRSDGLMLSRRVTGLCGQSQKRISSLVSMAHIAGLMPNLVPKYSKKDCSKKRREWKKYNTYFDESTIRTSDPLRIDKAGVKENFYNSIGLTWDKEPWKNRKQMDLSTRKLVHY